MYEQKTGNESAETIEGEYVGKGAGNGDPAQALNELVEDASRFIAENPKKTAIIATATAAAAVAAAVTAAAVTAAFLVAGELGKWWSKPKR